MNYNDTVTDSMPAYPAFIIKFLLRMLEMAFRQDSKFQNFAGGIPPDPLEERPYLIPPPPPPPPPPILKEIRHWLIQQQIHMELK